MRIAFTTVGIIAKNEEAHIEETIKSILNSDYPKNNYEILIVDGNSKDKTQGIVQELMKSNKNIRLLPEPWKKGTHGKARNFLADNARGEYVAFTDGDCVVEKDWLKVLVETLTQERIYDKKVVAVGGIRRPIKTTRWKEDVINNVIYTFFGCGGSSNFVETKKKYVGAIPNYNSIYVKDVVRKERYSGLGFGEDYEFNLRLVDKGYKIVFSKEAVIYHHQEPSFSKFSKQMYNYGKAQINIYRKIGQLRYFAVVAPLFILGLFFGLVLSLLSSLILKIYLTSILIYIALDLYYFLKILLNSKKFYSAVAIFVFPLIHISYGWGVLIQFVNKNEEK